MHDALARREAHDTTRSSDDRWAPDDGTQRRAGDHATAPFDRWLAGVARHGTDVLEATTVVVAVDGTDRHIAAAAPHGTATSWDALRYARGPWSTVFAHASATVVDDITQTARPWPQFAARARMHGVRSALAAPLGARGHVWGVVTFLHPDGRTFEDRDQRIAGGFADLVALAGARWHPGVAVMAC